MILPSHLSAVLSAKDLHGGARGVSPAAPGLGLCVVFGPGLELPSGLGVHVLRTRYLRKATSLMGTQFPSLWNGDRSTCPDPFCRAVPRDNDSHTF